MKSREPNELKIYQAASLIIDEYGEDALIRAAQQYDELLDQGDIDGMIVWKRIVEAVREMLAEVVPEGVTVH